MGQAIAYGLADRHPPSLPLDGGSEDNGWYGPLSSLQGDSVP